MAPFAPLCPHCGAPAPSLEALRSGYRCTYCDRVVDATPHPAAQPTPAPIHPAPSPNVGSAKAQLPSIEHATATKVAKGGAGCGISSLVFACLIAFLFSSPKSCAMLVLSDETASALAAVRKCPRAMELLGNDPSPSWYGCSNGQSKSGCDSGSGHWSIPVSGSRARGTLDILATKHRKSGWRAEQVTLEIGDTRVDVMQCQDIAPSLDD